MRLPYKQEPIKFETPAHQEFLDKILKTRGKYGLSPLDHALIHSPSFFKGFMQFFTAIRADSTLPEDVREFSPKPDVKKTAY